MLAVGNDVVDLENPDALGRSLDERFVRRVFLPEEQRLIFRDRDPDCILWVLWAAKETAYKIISKSCPSVHSGPLKYRVNLEETSLFPQRSPDLRSGHFTCQVETPVGLLMIGAQTGRCCVHAFGSRGDPLSGGALHLKVFRLDRSCVRDRDESGVVRSALGRYLSRYWQIPFARIDIRRDLNDRGWGPPVVYVDGTRAPVDTSLSHHGRYGAFALFTGGCRPSIFS